MMILELGLGMSQQYDDRPYNITDEEFSNWLRNGPLSPDRYFYVHVLLFRWTNPLGYTIIQS